MAVDFVLGIHSRKPWTKGLQGIVEAEKEKEVK